MVAFADQDTVFTNTMPARFSRVQFHGYNFELMVGHTGTTQLLGLQMFKSYKYTQSPVPLSPPPDKQQVQDDKALFKS